MTPPKKYGRDEILFLLAVALGGLFVGMIGPAVMATILR